MWHTYLWCLGEDCRNVWNFGIKKIHQCSKLSGLFCRSLEVESQMYVDDGGLTCGVSEGSTDSIIRFVHMTYFS